jgi:hypothetical protein
MKTFVRHALTLVAITVACQAGLALAEDNYYWVSGGDQSAVQAVSDKVAGQGQSGCNSCCPDQGCCDRCDGCGSGECDPKFGVIGTFGLDTFKGVSDMDISNFGAVTGFNTGVLLPGAEDYGFGWQTGISYGLYDFDGRFVEGAGHTAHTQQQTFVTTGFYRKAQGDQRVSFGLVYDWMYNNGWGGYGVNSTLGQWRGQVEYALSSCNSVGVWGTKNDLGSNKEDASGYGTVTNRALSQVNMFWHHKFACSNADSWLYTGLVANNKRLDQSTFGGGSLGDWTIGASFVVPLSERLALYANGSYMHPTCTANNTSGWPAEYDSGYNVSMGVAWYFGCHARSCSLQGKSFLPYMPLANNSNFMVDQSAQ